MIPTTMKAVYFLGDQRLEIREVPVPRPDKNEVLVQLKTGAICGSDIHFYRSRPEVLIPDIVSGHEPAGIVAQIGEEVRGLAIGDRVCVYHFQGCGTCEYCASGHINNCQSARQGCGWDLNGSNAQYMVMRGDNCMKLPDALSFADGSIIACIGATAYSALRKLNLSGRDLLVVYGLGAVGQACVLLAKAMGATVIGVELNEYRLQFSQELGADYVVNPNKEDLYEAVIRISCGHGADKSIETSGSIPLRKMMVKASAVHGHIVMVGFNEGCRDPLDECLCMFDSRYLLRNELILQGSYVMPRGMYDELVRFLLYKGVKLDSLVTHRFPLTKIQEAIALFDTGNSGKIILDFD